MFRASPSTRTRPDRNRRKAGSKRPQREPAGVISLGDHGSGVDGSQEPCNGGFQNYRAARDASFGWLGAILLPIRWRRLRKRTLPVREACDCEPNPGVDTGRGRDFQFLGMPSHTDARQRRARTETCADKQTRAAISQNGDCRSPGRIRILIQNLPRRRQAVRRTRRAQSEEALSRNADARFSIRQC